jgi:hypothetical protein
MSDNRLDIMGSSPIKFKTVDLNLMKSLEKMILDITIEDYNKYTDTIKYNTVDSDLLKSLEVLMMTMK